MLNIDKLILEFNKNSKSENIESNTKIDSKHQKIISQSKKI